MTPLFVIGGFLGSGKTTLLNQWLSQAGARRLAVLVNDFGAINIDAGLIAASAGDTIALTNGCVCCSIGDDLSAALIQVLDAKPGYDAIVVEASGVSDPWRIAQIALADAELELGGVIVLIDTAALPSQIQEPRLLDTLSRQAASADALVLNKIDLASDAQRQATQAWLQTQAPHTPQWVTQHAELPLHDIMQWVQSPKQAHRQHVWGHSPDMHSDVHECHEPGCTHPAHDHTSLFESMSWQPTHTLSPEDIRQRLNQMPAGVLRLKGWMPCSDGRWREVQYAGRHASLRVTDAPAHAQAVLVAIGLSGQLPQAALRALF